ncbi:MAG TPA: hypothetical protein VNV88_14605 [Candidatus Solibacter sp.]|nr:hypothetical protein [Candidatus Solibacter sp.]
MSYGVLIFSVDPAQARQVTASTIPGVMVARTRNSGKKCPDQTLNFTKNETLSFCHPEGAFFAPEELALRSSEGTYAFECAAKSLLAAIIFYDQLLPLLLHLPFNPVNCVPIEKNASYTIF